MHYKNPQPLHSTSYTTTKTVFILYNGARTKSLSPVGITTTPTGTNISSFDEDYGLFYTAMYLANSILSFTGNPGRTFAGHSGIILENNIVGEDTDYAINYWYNECGTYTHNSNRL